MVGADGWVAGVSSWTAPTAVAGRSQGASSSAGDPQAKRSKRSDSCDAYISSLRLIETKQKIKKKIREMEANDDSGDEDDIALLQQHLESIKSQIRKQINTYWWVRMSSRLKYVFNALFLAF